MCVVCVWIQFRFKSEFVVDKLFAALIVLKDILSKLLWSQQSQHSHQISGDKLWIQNTLFKLPNLKKKCSKFIGLKSSILTDAGRHVTMECLKECPQHTALVPISKCHQDLSFIQNHQVYTPWSFLTASLPLRKGGWKTGAFSYWVLVTFQLRGGMACDLWASFENMWKPIISIRARTTVISVIPRNTKTLSYSAAFCRRYQVHPTLAWWIQF